MIYMSFIGLSYRIDYKSKKTNKKNYRYQPLQPKYTKRGQWY